METREYNNKSDNFQKMSGMEAVILGLDGVIAQTVKVHKEVWKLIFNDYLEKQGKEYHPLTDKDYINYVDSKTRLQGIKSFLGSRKIKLPTGDSNDAPNKQTTVGLGKKKNAIFREQLKEKGVDIYEHAIDQIRYWREHGLKTAVVSSSKNCKYILETAGISNLFDVCVDGLVAEERNLKGKPDPDIFVAAAHDLGTHPSRCVVFDDSIVGVQAGSNGHFALVVGVNRADNETELKENGADIVVKNLNQIDLFNTTEIRSFYAQPLSSALSDHSTLNKLIADKTPVLFLDYDGTLTPIVNRPEDANLSIEMKNVLELCANQFDVAIVSGRDLDDVKTRVGLKNLIYVGSHGFRISGPNGLFMEHEKTDEILPKLNAIEKELQQSLGAIKGIQIDRKRYAVGVHYRNAVDDVLPQITKKTDDIVQQFNGFKRGDGKKIVEIKPDLDWHKGKAVQWLLQNLAYKNNDILPIFIGDDVTDEDGFKVVADIGIGILVGFHGKPTAAKYSLKNVYQVRKFLNGLASSRQNR